MRRIARRRSVGACLAVLAVGLLASGCDWAQFAGGYSHTGAGSGEVFITPANVSTLTSKFTTVPLSQISGDFLGGQVAIANGVIYAVGADGDLYAYDASGSDNCSNTPTTCAPLWTASLGGQSGLNDTTPAVAYGFVYVTSDSASGPNTIYAFDAAGKTDCSGSPTVCSPMWTASVDSGQAQNLTVHDEKLYAAGGGSMEVFDANGEVDCSGTPKTCSPMWSTTDIGAGSASVTLSNSNIAYVLGATAIYAFDGEGHTNCSGTPAVCSPLRSYPTQYPAAIPVVSGSTLYVDTFAISGTAANPTLDGGLEAFDATGSTNCSGTPAVCTPLWQSSAAYASQQPAAVANGDVYVPSSAGPIAAFSADGSTNCSGAPTICSPLWTTSVGGGWSPITIGGSVLYDTVSGHDVYAFDATGVNGCTLAVCTPLWTLANLATPPSTTLPGLGATIANGTLYVSGFTVVQTGDQIFDSGLVDAFGLP